MRIGGAGAGQVARRASRRRDRITGATPGDDAGTRLVRRLRVGPEFVRLDERRRNEAVTSVTIASDTTEALSSCAIGQMLDLYAAHPPDVFRTPAITHAEAAGYAECGFEIISALRLLTHDLERLANECCVRGCDLSAFLPFGRRLKTLYFADRYVDDSPDGMIGRCGVVVNGGGLRLYHHQLI